MFSSSRSVSLSKFTFVNVKCKCNKNSKILIANTAENGQKLFYQCDTCRLFKWWYEVKPNLHLLRADLYGEEVNQIDVNHENMTLKEEIKELKEKLKEMRNIVLNEANIMKSEMFKLLVISYIVVGAVVVLFVKAT